MLKFGNLMSKFGIMRYLVSEFRVLLSILSLALGIFLITKTALFADPVLVSEKGLLLLVLSLGLLVCGGFLAIRSVRKVH